MDVLSCRTVEEAESRDTPVLRYSSVTKTYPAAARRVLDHVTVQIDAGRLTAIVGPSGSGKSTLLNLAGGLDEPTAGTVDLFGARLGELTPEQRTDLRRRSVGYVFQEYNLMRTLTARENVALPLELDGTPGRVAARAADAALERVGIAPHAGKFPDALSGGEQQRVAIARAVVRGRRLLLADEPTGALDSANGTAIVALLADLAADGTACVVATHDPQVAAAADRVVRLHDGRIVDAGVHAP